MKSLILVFVLSLSASLSLARREQHSHSHGLSKMTIAIEQNKVEFEFSSPADNLLGFERIPKNEKEKNILSETADKLKNPNIFLSLESAKCKVISQNLKGGLFEDIKTKKDDKNVSTEHSEVEVEFELECADISTLKILNVVLFNSFNRIKNIEVQSMINGKSYSGNLNKYRNTIPGY